MVDVNPLRGWRYDLAQVGDLSDVVCPPYDVIDEPLQHELYKKHPCNVIRLELNRPEPGDADPEARYRRAADFWKRWRADGILLQEHEDALYVYHQEFEWEGKTYVRKGFFGRLRLEEFGGQVFPHEQTLSGPKADRLMLFQACKANLSPVFGLYPDAQQEVQRRLDEHCLPLTALQAVDHLGVKHRMWVVTDPAVINAVRVGMRDKPIFIADGHHRYETSLNYRRELKAAGQLTDDNAPPNFVLMMFVGMQDPGLQVLPTHRLVTGLGDVTLPQLQAALKSHFEMEPLGAGEKAAQEAWELVAADGGQDVFGFGTAADQQWCFARVMDAGPMGTLAADHSPAWRSLGVSLLQKLVLEHLLKQAVPAARTNCTYVHRLDEVTAAVGGKQCQLGCLVPPATIAHVEQIASNRETMPPKSTYFYPKLLTGLVFHALA
jgi:uncharacterized protein (DUF1015 family)